MNIWEYYELVEILPPTTASNEWTPKCSITEVYGKLLGSDGDYGSHGDTFQQVVASLGMAGWELFYIDSTPKSLMNRYMFKRLQGGE